MPLLPFRRFLSIDATKGSICPRSTSLCAKAARKLSYPDHQPDWDEVAARWLDLIRPVWYARLKLPRRKPLLLKDIRRDLIAEEATLGPQILEKFGVFPVLSSPEERISACILGVT